MIIGNIVPYARSYDHLHKTGTSFITSKTYGKATKG